MGIFETLFSSLGTWLGYVGACAVAPDATCRPFLAFLALGAAASAALTLLLIAYRSAYAGATAAVREAQPERKRSAEPAARPRRTLPLPPLPSRPALQGRLRAA